MYKKERLDQILEVIQKNGFVTVKYLTAYLGYSTATVNRDLNALVQMQKIKRSYGGAEAVQSKSTPLLFRYEKLKPVKKRIGREAASFVRNGETVFIDGSTTAQYLGPYLLGKTDLHVITNNLALAAFLSENGIRVAVLGGEIKEPPYMTDGQETVEQAMHFKADKAFISTAAVSSSGEVCTGDAYYFLHTVMAQNAKELFLLIDHEKIDVSLPKILFDFSRVRYVVSDFDFSAEI
ncbi:MAG: DeoR/GlpR family DNA-binding transcription regulator, partial [Clostridia bacterium]|nr:DeoR/GlpR family DNA-binding transcription regulator [Clostridia bacterium]